MADKEADHHHNPNFSATLRDVYREFQKSFNDCKTEVALEQDGMMFIGVPMGLKDRIDSKTLRKSVGIMLNITGKFSIVQVVGDSGTGYTFSARALMKLSIMSAVNTVSMKSRYAVVEYGYTAGMHDVNWVVNDVLGLIHGLKPLAVGNLVHQSIQALEEWGCEASGEVKHFLLAYNDDETKFGDDTWISDSIMDEAERDTLICVEGGPQSFFQAASVAARMVTVVAIYGGGRDGQGERLRVENPNDPESLHKRFSAAYLISQLKELFEQLVEQDEPLDTIKADLRMSLTLGLEEFTAKGGTLSHDQRGMIFDGLDILLSNVDSFRAVVSQCIDS